MLATPVRLLGQESAPAATSATAPNARPLAAVSKAGDKETEAEEDNVYRHAPIVQSIAKKFNLSVETTARFFEWINFAILGLAIGIPLAKVLPKVFRKRSETLSQNIESARKLTLDANTRLSAVEAKLSKLGDEIADIRAHVEEESKQDEIRIKASIEEESRASSPLRSRRSPWPQRRRGAGCRILPPGWRLRRQSGSSSYSGDRSRFDCGVYARGLDECGQRREELDGSRIRSPLRQRVS